MLISLLNVRARTLFSRFLFLFHAFSVIIIILPLVNNDVNHEKRPRKFIKNFHSKININFRASPLPSTKFISLFYIFFLNLWPYNPFFFSRGRFTVQFYFYLPSFNLNLNQDRFNIYSRYESLEEESNPTPPIIYLGIEDRSLRYLDRYYKRRSGWI